MLTIKVDNGRTTLDILSDITLAVNSLIETVCKEIKVDYKEATKAVMTSAMITHFASEEE